MPEIKSYTVSQTREVMVSATSLLAAAQIADQAFNGVAPKDIERGYGYLTSKVTDTDLCVKETF
jgi:hypothetical protein